MITSCKEEEEGGGRWGGRGGGRGKGGGGGGEEEEGEGFEDVVLKLFDRRDFEDDFLSHDWLATCNPLWLVYRSSSCKRMN